MEPRLSIGSVSPRWPHDGQVPRGPVTDGERNPPPGQGVVEANTLGLWAGFLDRLPLSEATSLAQRIEACGVDTIWLPEWKGVEPFIRAGLYLAATDRLTVATGVANAHARDAEAMVAAASTLEQAFPGRFVLGLGVSHRAVVEGRGHRFPPPLTFMRSYLDAMSSAGTVPLNATHRSWSARAQDAAVGRLERQRGVLVLLSGRPYGDSPHNHRTVLLAGLVTDGQ